MLYNQRALIAAVSRYLQTKEKEYDVVEREVEKRTAESKGGKWFGLEFQERYGTPLLTIVNKLVDKWKKNGGFCFGFSVIHSVDQSSWKKLPKR